MRGLSGRVALVTGAARGQGEAIARRLHADGATVVLTDVLVEVEAVADDLGDGATALQFDVSNEDAWQRVIDEIDQVHGRLDVVVNNAGVLRRSPIEDTSLEDFHWHVDINQIGCFLGIRSTAPLLRRSGGGAIVNVSSIAGRIGARGMIAYAATKAAILAMTRTAALELGRDGIRVNAVLPGAVDSPMARQPGFGDPDRDLDAAYAHLPAGRVGRPADVAGLVAYLVSDDAGYVTGAEFVIDGGSLAGAPTAPRS